MKIGVVIPVGPGREENVATVVGHLRQQTDPISGVAVLDGPDVAGVDGIANIRLLKKHEPGQEQPRNVGVRYLSTVDPNVTHAAFLDSDVIVEPYWHEALIEAYALGDHDRVMVAPYDWMGPGQRTVQKGLFNDVRWPMFNTNGPEVVFREDLSAGVACFSGNLVWPIDEFIRIGGFHPDLHHGRCEDGELGLRAVATGVGISFAAEARGYHLWHPVNTELILERNRRDVPLLNAWHPWVEGEAMFMVDRDGKAFDRTCSKCGAVVQMGVWWDHAAACGLLSAGVH